MEEVSNKPNYNLAVPKFVTEILPNGIIGPVMVALFSAAMSSLTPRSTRSQRQPSRICGTPLYKKVRFPKKNNSYSLDPSPFSVALIVFFSFFVGDISKSVIESVNKVGSLANGPILPCSFWGFSHPCGE